MHLVRTIQKREDSEWIRSVQGEIMPLPFKTHLDFRGVILIHRRGYFFPDASGEDGERELIKCGSLEDQPIREVTRVRLGRITGEGRAKHRGFTGIRYCERLEDWVEVQS